MRGTAVCGHQRAQRRGLYDEAADRPPSQTLAERCHGHSQTTGLRYSAATGVISPSSGGARSQKFAALRREICENLNGASFKSVGESTAGWCMRGGVLVCGCVGSNRSGTEGQRRCHVMSHQRVAGVCLAERYAAERRPTPQTPSIFWRPHSQSIASSARPIRHSCGSPSAGKKGRRHESNEIAANRGALGRRPTETGWVPRASPGSECDLLSDGSLHSLRCHDTLKSGS